MNVQIYYYVLKHNKFIRFNNGGSVLICLLVRNLNTKYTKYIAINKTIKKI